MSTILLGLYAAFHLQMRCNICTPFAAPTFAGFADSWSLYCVYNFDALTGLFKRLVDLWLRVCDPLLFGIFMPLFASILLFCSSIFYRNRITRKLTMQNRF